MSKKTKIGYRNIIRVQVPSLEVAPYWNKWLHGVDLTMPKRIVIMAFRPINEETRLAEQSKNRNVKE